MKGFGGFRSTLIAASMLGFAGAQRLDSKALMNSERASLSFDPNALLRGVSDYTGLSRVPFFRGTGSKRQVRRRYSSNGPAHCGAKQCAKYARQGADINRYYYARLAFIDRRRAAGDARYL